MDFKDIITSISEITGFRTVLDAPLEFRQRWCENDHNQSDRKDLLFVLLLTLTIKLSVSMKYEHLQNHSGIFGESVNSPRACIYVTSSTATLSYMTLLSFLKKMCAH